VDIDTDGALSMIGYTNGMVSLSYKHTHMHELGLQKELIQYHCIIYQEHLVDKALEFENLWLMSVQLNLLGHVGQTTDSSKRSLTKEKVNVVALCSSVKFADIAKAKFCNVFCDC